MSLDVSPQLLARAQQGEIDDATFVECIRTSLPYAWDLISGLVADLEVAGGDFADNQTPPPDEQARGQLLRVLASDAMRGSIERYFGVKLAFQNCHRVAVFPGKAGDTDTYRQFVTAREQILNQQPHLRDC
ncbi:SCO5389 family protein [Actinocorallia sp. A-T 12471]|uniref:SCO5389 family protein n=1 Tax=Actinocorallia sp. A-T 12471 TaxID=3089813 RepID=UPI0029D095BE|nr:SCO5389 family protein [Actinocorallia sp. A-T 12471]MDX6743718.1 SCO5389 family protein [Actinocorallia sp. A-T 12471]